MKTKIISLLFVFVVAGFTSVYAQKQDANRTQRFNMEEFTKKRIEFLQKEIGLTKEEATAFLPLSNELMQKKFELNRDLIRKKRSLSKQKSKESAEYEAIITESFEVRLKEIALEQEYYEKFKAVLSPEKIYKYQQAEKKLARNMVNNRERPNGKAPKNRKPGRRK